MTKDDSIDISSTLAQRAFRCVRIALRVGAASILLIAATLPAHADQTFNNPQVGGAIVDNCAVWANDCGWGGAHQFCQTQGYAAARSFQLTRPGRTYVIGSQQICEGAGCAGFSQVVCIAAGTTAPPPPTGPSTNLAGRWSWSAQCPESQTPYTGAFHIAPLGGDGSFGGRFENGNGDLGGRVVGNRMEFVRTGGGGFQQRWQAVATPNRMDGGIERPTEKTPNCTFHALRG
jgi:hypothetical protein